MCLDCNNCITRFKYQYSGGSLLGSASLIHPDIKHHQCFFVCDSETTPSSLQLVPVSRIEKTKQMEWTGVAECGRVIRNRGRARRPVGISGGVCDPQELVCLRLDTQELMVGTTVPVPVGDVFPRNLEGGMGLIAAMPPVTSTEGGHFRREWARVCFLCGCQGHGVNRCSQVDTSFPFIRQGWSVDVRNGQYRAIRTSGTGMWSAP